MDQMLPSPSFDIPSIGKWESKESVFDVRIIVFRLMGDSDPDYKNRQISVPAVEKDPPGHSYVSYRILSRKWMFRIRTFVWQTDPAPDPVIFVSNLQEAYKKCRVGSDSWSWSSTKVVIGHNQNLSALLVFSTE